MILWTRIGERLGGEQGVSEAKRRSIANGLTSLGQQKHATLWKPLPVK
jgi:hypothetical protein